MTPDVVLKRRDVEIADQDRRSRPRLVLRGPVDHFIDEGKLMGEFDIDLGVRLVAARRDVEIMQFKTMRLSAEDDMQMTGVALGAKVPFGETGERNARNDRNPVIALLPVDRDMGVAGVPERAVGKIGVRTFCLLQAQHIRLVLGEVADDQIDAQAHRIDVPRGDRKRHPRLRIMARATFPAAATSARGLANSSTAAVSFTATVSACGCQADWLEPRRCGRAPGPAGSSDRR